MPNAQTIEEFNKFIDVNPDYITENIKIIDIREKLHQLGVLKKKNTSGAVIYNALKDTDINLLYFPLKNQFYKKNANPDILIKVTKAEATKQTNTDNKSKMKLTSQDYEHLFLDIDPEDTLRDIETKLKMVSNMTKDDILKIVGEHNIKHGIEKLTPS